MRHCVLTMILTVILSPVIAEAGWLDNIKGAIDSKIKEVESGINNSVNEAMDDPMDAPSEEASESSTHTQTQAKSANSNQAEYEFGKLQDNAYWFTAPPGSTKAIDVEIKGLRLGMPEMFADEALAKEGFTRTSLNAYFQIVKKDDGEVLKRNDISFLSVEPSDEMLEELEEPLKSMVYKAKKMIEENNQKLDEQRDTTRRGRRTARSRASQDNSIPKTLRLIYKITYNQSFNQNTRQDKLAMREQLVRLFGPPSYGYGKGVSSHFLKGAAYKMNMQTDLYYHDAAHIPVAEKESLIRKAKVNEQKGVYDGFVHPCASGSGGKCPGLGMSAAYPEDFDLQMEANRIMHAPYMGIRMRGRRVETTLEWTYLQSEKGIRKYHAKQKAHEKAPVATVDF